MSPRSEGFPSHTYQIHRKTKCTYLAEDGTCEKPVKHGMMCPGRTVCRSIEENYIRQQSKKSKEKLKENPKKNPKENKSIRKKAKERKKSESQYIKVIIKTGDTVTVRCLNDNETYRFTIRSNDIPPLQAAVIGKRVGSTVKYNEFKYRVLAIK